MNSIRQQIMDNVETRFKSITVAAGYLTNLGYKVYQWRTIPITVEDYALIYRDASCESSFHATGLHLHKITLELQILVAGETTYEDCRKLIADVMKAIGIDVTWGNLAINTYPVSDVISINHEKNIIGGISIQIMIHFRTREWDHCNQ